MNSFKPTRLIKSAGLSRLLSPDSISSSTHQLDHRGKTLSFSLSVYSSPVCFYSPPAHSNNKDSSNMHPSSAIAILLTLAASATPALAQACRGGRIHSYVSCDSGECDLTDLDNRCQAGMKAKWYFLADRCSSGDTCEYEVCIQISMAQMSWVASCLHTRKRGKKNREVRLLTSFLSMSAARGLKSKGIRPFRDRGATGETSLFR